jgi:hypothetical protein
MSINLGIYWVSKTNECIVLRPEIDSDDPNEPFEAGYRKTYVPFPNSHPDDQKFFGVHQKMFSDGPKLKFIASDKFTGSLYGYIYQMGPKGVGYYIDPLVMRHVFYK